AGGDKWHGNALNSGAVELLEVIERFRNRFGGNGGDRRQRHHGAARGADVVVEQLLGIETISLLDLRDHLVGAPRQAEIVDVAAPQHGGQATANIAHLEAQLRGLVAIDGDHRLGQVKLEVGIEENEHAALGCRIEELAGDVVEPLEGLGRLYDE